MSELTPESILKLLPEKFNPEAAGDWKALIQLVITGENGGAWFVKIGNGEVEVGEGRIEGATATMETSEDVWVGMFDGSVNPQMAFMTGRLKIDGNIADILKLDNSNIFRK